MSRVMPKSIEETMNEVLLAKISKNRIVLRSGDSVQFPHRSALDMITYESSNESLPICESAFVLL